MILTNRTKLSIFKMNNFDLKWCNKILDKMLEMPIVEVINSAGHTSEDEKKCRIDFDFFKKRLSRKEFKSPMEFVDELKIALKMVKKHKEKNKDFVLLVEELEDFINKKFEKKPKDIQDEYIKRINKMTKRINKHMEKCPDEGKNV